MTGTTLSSEGLDLRRRKLLYRSWHRGLREMDLIMGGFADAKVAQLSEGELGELERLIDVPDCDLLAWITGERGGAAGFRQPAVSRPARLPPQSGRRRVGWRNPLPISPISPISWSPGAR